MFIIVCFLWRWFLGSDFGSCGSLIWSWCWWRMLGWLLYIVWIWWWGLRGWWWRRLVVIWWRDILCYCCVGCCYEGLVRNLFSDDYSIRWMIVIVWVLGIVIIGYNGKNNFEKFDYVDYSGENVIFRLRRSIRYYVIVIIVYVI